MTAHAIDARDLPRLHPEAHPSPLWWGIVGLIVIETTVFASLIASYFYLRLTQGEWPPADVAPPPLLWASVNALLLLVSSGSMYLAGRLIQRGRPRAMALAIFASIVLAAVVLMLRSLELRAVPFSWTDHAYGSLYWTIMGLHVTHVLVSLLVTTAIGVLGALEYFTPQRHLAVRVVALYWYFVALIWLPVYAVLYWSPRLT